MSSAVSLMTVLMMDCERKRFVPCSRERYEQKHQRKRLFEILLVIRTGLALQVS